MKKLILSTVVVLAVGVGGIALGLRMRGLSFEEAAGMGREAITGKASRRTTEGVVAEVEKAKPALALLAKAAGSKLRINVFKVSYPNDFDKAMAEKEGRTNLGGDIMIHGSNATIGCVPIGDKGIEDIFYLVAKVGFKNVEIVIAPYDMRKGRRPELEESSLAWYPRLCDDICAALNKASR